jgi:hypothetical protein
MALPRKLQRQAPADVPQATGLAKRNRFGRGKEDVHGSKSRTGDGPKQREPSTLVVIGIVSRVGSISLGAGYQSSRAASLLDRLRPTPANAFQVGEQQPDGWTST